MEAVLGIVSTVLCTVYTAFGGNDYIDRIEKMRLDRFLSDMGAATRTRTKKAVRGGGVLVNGIPAKKSDMHIEPCTDKVIYCGEEIKYQEFVYVMLNKPEGYISATDDKSKRTVLDLLSPRLAARELFPCGRLDIDTVGLLILTDDGKLSHALLSPKHHAEKVYRFETDVRLPDDAPERVAEGLLIDDGYKCLPAKLSLDSEGCGGTISLHEGKFHQIKRMAHALGAEIIFLERVCFGGVELDRSLSRGEWRELTDDELGLLQKYRIE